MMMGSTALALPFLQRAVQEWPTYVVGHRTLILCLFRLGRFDEARKTAIRLLEIVPDQRVGPEVSGIYNPEYVTELRHALASSGIPL
jgi:Tetratricopeptide repeat